MIICHVRTKLLVKRFDRSSVGQCLKLCISHSDKFKELNLAVRCRNGFNRRILDRYKSGKIGFSVSVNAFFIFILILLELKCQLVAVAADIRILAFLFIYLGQTKRNKVPIISAVINTDSIKRIISFSNYGYCIDTRRQRQHKVLFR